jgi:hypothetical protein
LNCLQGFAPASVATTTNPVTSAPGVTGATHDDGLPSPSVGP